MLVGLPMIIFLCNTMIAKSAAGYDNPSHFYTISGGMSVDHFTLLMPKTFENSEQVLNWLDANPTYVQFPIRTPYNEPIPYQDIATYYSTTIITTDSELTPTIKAKVKTIDT